MSAQKLRVATGTWNTSVASSVRRSWEARGTSWRTGDPSAVTVSNRFTQNTVRPAGSTLVSMSFITYKLTESQFMEKKNHIPEVWSLQVVFERTQSIVLPFQVLTMPRWPTMDSTGMLRRLAFLVLSARPLCLAALSSRSKGRSTAQKPAAWVRTFTPPTLLTLHFSLLDRETPGGAFAWARAAARLTSAASLSSCRQPSITSFLVCQATPMILFLASWMT